mgnify:CR=1 FL=1
MTTIPTRFQIMRANRHRTVVTFSGTLSDEERVAIFDKYRLTPEERRDREPPEYKDEAAHARLAERQRQMQESIARIDHP